MSHADKVEVMDFLINVLKDHEKNLDTLISRAEILLEENQTPKNLIQNPPGLRINLKDWEEFRERALGSELVCFDLKNSTFYCHAILESKIFIYSEETPKATIDEKNNNVLLSPVQINGKENQFTLLNNKLSIGMEIKAKTINSIDGKHQFYQELDLLYTRNWLSKELGIHRDFIVQGNIVS